MPMIRIGLDTGGTFTDVVAVDEETGRLMTTKTPSTPADPAVGFMTGIDKILTRMGLGGDALSAVCHGTTVATNKLLEGKVENLGFITTDGYEHLLEIARQSVPDGYGNSYFWVKPPRIVPAHRVQTVGGRLGVDGSEIRPFDEEAATVAAAYFRDAGIATIGVCFLHSYANPDHENAMREIIHRVHPAAVVSISSDVLREYREYERSMTTLVDAAVKPNITRYVATITSHLDAYTRAGSDPAHHVPFYVMKSNGGVLSADEVVHQPITTVLSGPAAGALGAAAVTHAAGFDTVVTCDGGGTSTDVTVVVDGRPALTTEGRVGAYPSKVPMVDVVTVGAGGGSVAWISPEGTLKVGPRSAGADPGPMCYDTGGEEPTITDAHLLLGRIPLHLLGGEVPLRPGLARRGIEALARGLDLGWERAATGILEISAWNQANALRQITVKRGLDVREFHLATFGGSGSLLACRLVDVLGLRGVVVPLNPGNVSAYGLLTVDVRNDYVRTTVVRQSRLDTVALQATVDELTAEADAALEREGFAPGRRQFAVTADLRYFGQAFEVRVEVPSGPLTPVVADQVADRFHDEHLRLYGYDFRADSRQGVEWVNLRVSGIGPIRKPEISEVAAGTGAGGAVTGSRRVYFDDWVDATIYDRDRLGAGDRLVGPAVVEEFSSTVPLHPGFTAVVDRFGNLVISRVDEPAVAQSDAAGSDPGVSAPQQSSSDRTGVDPILVEIVEGYLASVELEVETAIGRTSRSPMIRDAHDYRAGIHDRRLRKLTGRSYSALVQPVVRDFPIEQMRPGDIFFHNDVYQSEGGIGHLPDLCVTAPVFAPDGAEGSEVVAFVQAFGHHDDIGGAVPGSMPSHATSVFEEGLMVPPIKLWDAGVPCQQALTIMTRNSRMPESLAADLDAECSACLMGARRMSELFERYGRARVEGCFDAILDQTTATFRREILAKIPDGSYVWEDYAEHDGVDEPRLHTQRITLTKVPDEGGRLIIDFAGTAPQAKGPINHCGDYAEGNFLKKWLAPILRNLADTPERMAQLDVNEGVVPLIEMRFPPPGTLLTPIFPAPTNARTFVILRLLGVLAGVLAKAVDGRMPADQETIRYTGVYGDDLEGNPYLMREVLGGGSGGRYYADGEDTIHVVPDSRNLPSEFSESRFPFVVERLGLAKDSGGAGRYRGGCGYDKHIRMLADAHFMSIADRSILSCWGVNGGKAGRPFEVTIDPGGPGERTVDALADAEFVAAGQVIRIRTTGGGGWGDPLERPYGDLARDIAWGKVSVAAAAADYGVLLPPPAETPATAEKLRRVAVDDGLRLDSDGIPVVDVEGSDALRARLRTEREANRDAAGTPFFDRGPGYARLSGGAAYPDVDLL